MVDFCLTTSREEVRSRDGSTVSVITALAPPPHPRFSKFFTEIKQDLGFGVYVPDCDTTACAFSAATQAGSTDSDPGPAAARLLRRLSGSRRRQRAARHRAAQRQHRLRGRRRHLDRQSRGRTAVRQRPRSDAQSRHPRSLFPQLRALEDHRDPGAAGHGAAHHRLPEKPRRKRRVRQSARAHLLSAGAVLRLFRPLLHRLHRTSGGGARGDRPRRRVRFHPRQECWPMCRPS